MILSINPAASAPTPTQIATQDLNQFNVIASQIHDRMLNGIQGSPAVVNQQGQLLQPDRPGTSAEDYNAGLVVAIGQEAFDRLQAAAAALIGG